MTEHCTYLDCKEEATHHIAVAHHRDRFGQMVFDHPYCLKHTRYALKVAFDDIVSYHPIHREVAETGG